MPMPESPYTIPAIVAVTVELSPQQSSAIPNSTGATVIPSSGLSRPCASMRSDTTRPPPWNVAAASTSSDALMVSANISATVESIVANFSASFFSGTVWP